MKRARLFAIQHATFFKWKCRDHLTTLFIHVETCRNMLYVVERSLIGIKNVALTNVVQQYISFVSVVWNKCLGKMFSAFELSDKC